MTTSLSVRGAKQNNAGELVDGGGVPLVSPVATLATITTDLATAAANATISGNATALATVTQCQTDVTALSASLSLGSCDVILGVNIGTPAGLGAKLTAAQIRRWVARTLGQLGLHS